jgi:hypothetical protein
LKVRELLVGIYSDPSLQEIIRRLRLEPYLGGTDALR